MTIRRIYAPLFIALCALPLAGAYADSASGTLGGTAPATRTQPLNNNAVILPQAPQPVQADAAPQTRKPLLVIRYTKNRVYYDKMLRQAVKAAEKTRPGGVVYEVVNALPPVVSGSQLSNSGDNNLIGVIQAMEDLGVPDSRIHSSTVTGTAPEQEISVYVQ